MGEVETVRIKKRKSVMEEEEEEEEDIPSPLTRKFYIALRREKWKLGLEWWWWWWWWCG